MTSTPWDWPGARWWKCDLHVHTPASYDYNKPHPALSDWIHAAKDAGLAVVAVTDHNTALWVDDVRNPYFTVFPGVELTVTPGVHVLVLFDPAKGRDTVNALLARAEIPPEKYGDPEAISPLSVEKVLEAASRLGGLCIAAHVDAKKGLLRVLPTGQGLMQIVSSPQLAAVEVKHREWEVPDPTDETKRIQKTWDGEFARFVDGSLNGYRRPAGPLAIVSSSDSHELATIGRRFTWVKMTQPTLEGLRLALGDGAISVQNDLAGAVDPNEHSPLAIEAIEIRKARHIGRSAPFDLRLNPWLSTVIGGRGTGKSTVVELLRAALRREGELPVTLRKEWDDLVRIPEPRGRGVLTPDTEVVVTYRKDGARFRIQWDPGGKLAAVLAQQDDGTWLASPGTSVVDRFPVRIYSQKQVYELTREPYALLRIVDDAPEVDHRQWRERWNAEESRFLSLRAQARELTVSLKEEPRLKGELEDLRRRLAVFEGAGHAAVLKAWQSRRRQERALEAWEAGLRGAATQIHALASAAEPPLLDATLFDPADPADVAVTRSVADAMKQMEDIRRDAIALAARADAILAAWVLARGASPWADADRASLEAYETLVAALKAAGTSDPSEYGRLVQQRQVLDTRLATFEGKRAAWAAIDAQAEQSLLRLRRLREELTQKRSAFLRRVLDNNPFVRIEVVPFGAMTAIEPELRRILGKEDNAFQKDIGAPDEPGTLLGNLASTYMIEFERGAAAVRAAAAIDLAARLDDMKKRLRAIAAGTTPAQHATFAKHMAARPPEQLDRLDAWFPPDTLLVSFKAIGQGQGFQPITQGSPGQRSAALLAFLLWYGDEPIVLDQPEDDLDNHLIYDLIVKQLHLNKRRRQVIVVTHNANIVVNGDAEMVIALDVKMSQTLASCVGGLQEEAVRDEVCRIMEGGREAFRARYRRIAHGGEDV